LAATFVGLQLRSGGEEVPLRQSLVTFPTVVGEWEGRQALLLEGDTLQVLRASDYLVRRYSDGTGRNLWLYVGYWQSQRKGAQPHSPKNCLPGSGWEPLEAARMIIPLAGGRSLPVNRFVIQKGQDQQVVLYWYQAQGRPVSGEIEAKLEMVRSALFRNRTDGAIIRVTSPVYGSVQETTAWLARYAQALDTVLDQYLPA
jgi:EpsI family protein